MKAKSCTSTTAATPPIRPVAIAMASGSWVALRAAARRSE